MSFDEEPTIGAFLRLLRYLPAELALKMPVLCGIADLCGGLAGVTPGLMKNPASNGVSSFREESNCMRGMYPAGGIRRRLDRRYARICVVHAELGKLDFKQAKAGTGLEDMVFAQTDFDVYQKISREDFNTFFDEGLDDFGDSFYKNNCMMEKDAVRKAISRWYRPEGEHYSCAVMNPLLMGIMRTLHTSLNFAPLVQPEETLAESKILIHFLQSQDIIVPALGEDALSGLAHNFPALFSTRLLDGLIRSLNGVTVIHPDGMATTLSVPADETPPVLYGTFHPANKAHTIRLA